jgi:hypothetical protein
VQFAKEAVDRAVSFGLEDGLRLERRLFHLSFATGEFQQGMQRFLVNQSKKPKSNAVRHGRCSVQTKLGASCALGKAGLPRIVSFSKMSQ